jgi:hypothetical protein
MVGGVLFCFAPYAVQNEPGQKAGIPVNSFLHPMRLKIRSGRFVYGIGCNFACAALQYQSLNDFEARTVTKQPVLNKCDRCGLIRITALVTFKQNVSFFFRRWQREFSGRLCFRCMTLEFLKFELATSVGTWWGIIGLLLGPYYILTNLLEYLAGSSLIARDAARWRSR